MQLVIGSRVMTNNCEEGVIVGIDHVAPAMENCGYDGQQSYPETIWYSVQHENGRREAFDAGRLRVLSVPAPAPAPRADRFDPDAPYTPDYLDDCARCGAELERGELAWEGDQLVCAACETAPAPELRKCTPADVVELLHDHLSGMGGFCTPIRGADGAPGLDVEDCAGVGGAFVVHPDLRLWDLDTCEYVQVRGFDLVAAAAAAGLSVKA